VSRFVAYHNVSAAAHQAKVDELAPLGFRPTALSVSGDPQDARYAAVWQQRPGPAWVAVHGLFAADYQTRFNQLNAEGFAPILVTVTGEGNAAIFAAVFEAGVSTSWYARHGLRWDSSGAAGSVNFENDKAFAQGFIPRCLAVYGDETNPLFAGVWVKNDRPVPWSWWWTDPETYQRIFDAEVDAGSRLAYISVAPTHWILSVFRDEPLGEWSSRHGITADGYQAEFDLRTRQGLEPLVVQAGGAGADARYATVFVRTDVPLARQWTVTGPAFDGAATLDAIVRGFMNAHAVRAMSIAVARRGAVVAKRGYTWAEAGYPITQPDTLFRVASVTKIFTCAAIDRLVQTGAISFDTTAFPYLGITSKLLPGQTPDPDIDKITVKDLAIRQSGLPHDFGTDFRTIASQLGISVTPSRWDLVQYVYGLPLVARPGTGDNYSNSAFEVLTTIVERASGRSYLDYVKQEVLAPLGISDVWIGATRSGACRANEVPGYDHPGVSDSLVDMTPGAKAANAYGGQVITENTEGVGALIMSAATIATTIATHSVWNIGGREIATRYGEMDGTNAGAVSRNDRLDFGYAFNRRVTTAELDGITKQIHSFLNVHGARL
jgi:CubicO group peptidase (beta-lactamase class C family)